MADSQIGKLEWKMKENLLINCIEPNIIMTKISTTF